MTEEEINKKAEKHCNEVLCNAHEKCNEVIKCRDWRSRRAGFFCGYEQALKDFEKENAELKADKNANEGENYKLRIKIAELQELLTDSLFYCYHVDPYYIDCLKEDEIFERAEKLGVKYNV